MSTFSVVLYWVYKKAVRQTKHLDKMGKFMINLSINDLATTKLSRSTAGIRTTHLCVGARNLLKAQKENYTNPC